MATLIRGDSVYTVSVSGEPDYVADSTISRLTLTNGAKVADTTKLCAVSATTTLWQADNHGVSATAASCDAAFVAVDPESAETTSLEIDIIATYTTVSSTSTTADTTYRVLKREMGMLFIPGQGRDSSGTQRFLTKIEAKNRNSGSSDAVLVRILVFG